MLPKLRVYVPVFFLSPISDITLSSISTISQSARALFYHEENTVMERDPQGDLQSHQAACTELKNIMSQIKDLKEKYEAAGEDEVSSLTEKGFLVKQLSKS